MALTPCFQNGSSFDHLVGQGEERDRNCEAERLRGLQIDGQAEVRRLLEGQVHRLRSFENAVNKGCHPLGPTVEKTCPTWPVQDNPLQSCRRMAASVTNVPWQFARLS